jgi:hypothetical protein
VPRLSSQPTVSKNMNTVNTRICRYRGNNWTSTPCDMPTTTLLGVTLAQYKGTPRAFVTSAKGDSVDPVTCLRYTEYSNPSQTGAGQWGTPQKIPSGVPWADFPFSTHRIGACVFKDSLYCMFRSQDGEIHLMSQGHSDHLQWSRPTNVGGSGRSNDGPAICSFDGYLVSAIRGNDGYFHWSKSTNG